MGFRSRARVHQRIVGRLSAYLDGELPPGEHHEVRMHLEGCQECLAVWDRIQHADRLARTPEAVDVPPTIWAKVEARVSRRPRPSGWVVHPLRLFRGVSDATWRRYPVATAASAAVLALILVQRLPPDATLSAEGILALSEQALAKVVRPGEIFHRRWAYYRRVHPIGGEPAEYREILHSWIDGSNLARTAGRLYSTDGRLLYASVVPGSPSVAPLVYFSPDSPGPYRGVEIRMYTPDDRVQAISRFSPDDQARLRQLFGPSDDPPLVGEVVINRQLIQGPSTSGRVLQRIRTSLDFSELGGEPVARIRTVDPLRPLADLDPDGDVRAVLARIDTVRWISRLTYLTLRVESTATLEDGRRLAYSSDLLEMRSLPPSDLEIDPFHFDVPPGTPVMQHQLEEQLHSLAAALRRMAEGSTGFLPMP